MVVEFVMCGQAKKHYEKAFREAEKAQDVYKKAEQDINLSKADVEKVNFILVCHSCLYICVHCFTSLTPKVFSLH